METELTVGNVLELQQGLSDLRRLTDERSGTKINGTLRYRIFLLTTLTKDIVESFEKAAGSLINDYAYEIFDISPHKVDKDDKPVKVSTNKWQYNSPEDKRLHLEALEKMRSEKADVKINFAMNLSELIELNLSADSLISLRTIVKDDMADKTN